MAEDTVYEVAQKIAARIKDRPEWTGYSVWLYDLTGERRLEDTEPGDFFNAIWVRGETTDDFTVLVDHNGRVISFEENPKTALGLAYPGDGGFEVFDSIEAYMANWV